MPDYTVQIGAVDVTQQELMAATRRIQTLITELESEARSSLANWEGSVREFYYVKKAEWDAGAAKMTEAAGKAGVNLSQINGSYNQAERYGTSLWS
ncbi:WXG100 family type VII secretion target [Streptomyces dysideae]|uniref:ESAT-6-like protein n=1 Tax=Streptomyces dysideae TaxID=909626 RepID=A0A101UV92_9ACTN|nr:WXG100 family type VII secretion target [Streptomyces dysideae]KUO17518.1 hypothetical protein AQJ91_29405 [Streptomyces dysideae]